MESAVAFHYSCCMFKLLQIFFLGTMDLILWDILYIALCVTSRPPDKHAATLCTVEIKKTTFWPGVFFFLFLVLKSMMMLFVAFTCSTKCLCFSTVIWFLMSVFKWISAPCLACAPFWGVKFWFTSWLVTHKIVVLHRIHQTLNWKQRQNP